MSPRKHIVFIVIIAARNKKDEIIELLAKNEAQLINTTYARGSTKASSLLSAFGLVAEEGKVLSSGLMPGEKADKLIDLLNREHDFSKLNTGIAFTIPVEGLSY